MLGTHIPKADCLVARHEHLDPSCAASDHKSQHRHVQFTFSTFFRHVDLSQREAVPRYYRFAERFGAEISHVFLALDSAYCDALGPVLTLHPQARRICVIQPMGPHIPMCLWASAAEPGSRRCGTPWVLGPVRRCCLVPVTEDKLTGPLDGVKTG